MSLIDEIIKGLLPEQNEKKTTAIYAGGFKPPTSGHFEVVTTALKKNRNIDEFLILVGGKDRDGISQSDSILIWDIYKKYLPIMVNVISSSKPPIQAVYNYAKEHPDENVLFVIGAREGNEADFSDITLRTKSVNNYPNLKVEMVVTQGGVSGTAARSAAKISIEKFKSFIPKELNDEEIEEVFNLVSTNVTEEKIKGIDGKACWDGYRYAGTKNGKDKCVSIKENASYSKDINILEKISQLTTHMISKGYNIEPLPTIELINGDKINAKNFFGKTAYYNPNDQHIVLYTEGRHPIDIVSSYAHEMVHHIQYLENRLGDIQTTDTQNKELEKLEKEAYQGGGIMLRAYKDSVRRTIISKTQSNSLQERIVGDKIECDNCDWSWNIKDGGDDLYICHKCWYDNTPSAKVKESSNPKSGKSSPYGSGFIPVKEKNDPFGLNQFAREIAEEVITYQIYCDLDGVLADFELGYKELTGVDLSGIFKPEGKEFWDPITKAGVKFWVGLKWMPGGQKLWDYIKKYDPKLLSAPSRESSSRIGKAVWVKHKIPGTKLLLRYADRKKEFANPLSILIDDRINNINSWENAGGIGILHTNTEDTIKQLQNLGL